MVPLLAIDLRELDEELTYLRIPLLVIVVLGVVTAQVVLVCVWRLVSMVRRGTVFSHRAFRYVDVVIGAFVAAAVLSVLARGPLGEQPADPDDAVAPGIVLLICGVVAASWVSRSIVLVLRMLLAQAVERDVEKRRCRPSWTG